MHIMKLLREYIDSSDAQRLSERLKGKGIMVFISSSKSHRIPMTSGGSPKVGVWAVFDFQYNDAVELLTNKKHKVRQPLSFEEMKRIEAQASQEFSSKFRGALRASLTYTLAAFLLVIVAAVFYSVVINA